VLVADVKRVPLLDPTRAYAKEKAQLDAAAIGVLASGRYILGPEVESFEAACKTYLGVEHALGVSSGTDALLMALMALELGPGDEVIAPTYTFFATAGSVHRRGARTVFVDSCPRCMNLVPAAVERAMTKRTKAILPVHLFGQACELGPILALAKKRGVAVIEDACQAIGAAYKGKRVGALGDFGCFSFFPSKNLGAFGDAGLITTSSSEHAQTLRALRSHGEKTRYDHQLVGGNFRIDALQAALLKVKLANLEAYNAARAAHAALYTELLTSAGIAAPARDGEPCSDACAKIKTSSDAPVLLPAAAQPGHVWNQYVIRVPGRRDALKQHLTERGVDTAIYYPVPLHLQKALQPLGHKPGDFPVAERLAEETLALPVFAELTADEVRYVAEQIITFTKA
jgi:dTDP-4-amino-4,6-dideoxygalactose transaminase